MPRTTADKVTHADLETGLKDLGSGFEDILRHYCKESNACYRDWIKAGIILSLRRDTPIELAIRRSN